jgi:hypothetical protein
MDSLIEGTKLNFKNESVEWVTMLSSMVHRPSARPSSRVQGIAISYRQYL